MRKLIAIFFILIGHTSHSQSGTWTWMNGDSVPGPAHYGIQGVPSTLNHPPGLYEASQWTDLQGKFWMYGGLIHPSGNGFYENVLWKFDPLTNEWMWISGDTVPGQLPVFGIKGIASPGNSPGANVSSCSVVDAFGNLWLFGGNPGSFFSSNQLWKYDISSNMWTWISGDSTFGSIGNYGTKGVPSILNCPPSRHESNTAWSINTTLWFFGGSCLKSWVNLGTLNDLWRFDIGSKEWTWMNGDSTLSIPAVYGIKGVSNPLNDPGGRLCYSHWKENNNNLWIFGGSPVTNWVTYLSDMWKYDLSINQWTWMNGSNLIDDPGVYNSYCEYDSIQYPRSRAENKACWIDTCGTFWMMGGGWDEYLNDLWRFNPVTNQWKFVNGDSGNNSLGNFGMQGVSASSNSCPSRFGAVSWTDLNGSLWLFGGYTPISINTIGDMWRFTPDSGCSSCSYPSFNLQATNSSVCPGTCIDFISTSMNVDSFQWYFPGGNPDTSSLDNPTNICYAQPGFYDVTLIGSNGTVSDTLTFQNYIQVYPSPSAQAITQHGDTLIANQGSLTYQWFFNGSLIPGATEYFHIALSSGDYNVVATDSNGCEVEAAVFNVIALTENNNHSEKEIQIIPNPAFEKIEIVFTQNLQPIDFNIYDVLGILCLQIKNYSEGNKISLEKLNPGIYFLEITNQSSPSRVRFVKQ